MASARKLWFRLRSLGRLSRLESELDQELEVHLELEAEKNRRAGMSPEEARRTAHISLGGVEQTKERMRDAWGASFLEALGQDVRCGLRSIRQNKAFAATVVLTLGLGIGTDVSVVCTFPAVDTRSLVPGLSHFSADLDAVGIALAETLIGRMPETPADLRRAGSQLVPLVFAPRASHGRAAPRVTA